MIEAASRGLLAEIEEKIISADNPARRVMQILGSELLKISTLSGGTFRNLTHMTLADGKELVA